MPAHLFLLSLLLPSAQAETAEWRASLGAQVDAAPHGVIDLAARTSSWQLGLYTDTLDARWTPSGDRGRSWLALRGEALIAGVSIDPWYGGAPARELGFTTSYVGLEGGTVRYGQGGLYWGGQGHARRYLLGEPLGIGAETATGFLEDYLQSLDHSDVFAVRAEALAGWWSEDGHVWLRAGVDLLPDARDPVVHGEEAQPHAALTAIWRPQSPRLGPRAEARLGIARGQGLITTTRVGGLNPYVVPVAGAGWGEHWAETYAAGRAGPEAHLDTVDLALLTDLALIESDAWEELRTIERWNQTYGYYAAAPAPSSFVMWGVSAQARWQPGRFFAEGALGRGFLERAEGVSPWAGWLLVGLDWGTNAGGPDTPG